MAAPKTPEHREKIAAANRGITRSPETREKIRQARLGTRLSEEHKANLAAAARARWARARGEDPEAAAAAVPEPRARRSKTPVTKVTKKAEVKVTEPAPPKDTIRVKLPDGRIATAELDNDVAKVMLRIIGARGLDETPDPADYVVVAEWLDEKEAAEREAAAAASAGHEHRHAPASWRDEIDALAQTLHDASLTLRKLLSEVEAELPGA
jgi:hypothetical protein